MVIYLCVKELSKPGYKTCLISCRDKKKRKKGAEGVGWEETGSGSAAIFNQLGPIEQQPKVSFHVIIQAEGGHAAVISTCYSANSPDSQTQNHIFTFQCFTK